MMNRFRNGKSVFLFEGALIVAVILLALRHPPQSLLDYERLCRETTDPKEKEEIALAAVNFLRLQRVADSIAHRINKVIGSEKLSLPVETPLFPPIPAFISDSLAGRYDSLLTEKLPKLYWVRRNNPDGVRASNFDAATKIAVQLDSLAQYSYWLPLLKALENADEDAWRKWRSATEAATLSKQYLTESKFEPARLAAIYGLQVNDNFPDHRQKLDLCLRLQNALAEGRDSMFNLGFALADWIRRESRRAGYFLRLVSTEFNVGNQLFQLGHYDEALEKFKTVQQAVQQWRHFSWLWYYQTEVKERIAVVLWELGDYSGIMDYLNQYGSLAKTTRQKTLYHIDRGLAAQLIGNFQAAEDEFKRAIACGKGNPKENLAADRLNAWYAYLMLGNLYLEYNLPDEALTHFQAAKAYADSTEDFLNAERASDYWLYLAKTYVQQQDMPAAQKALDKAKAIFIDSPVLRVKSFFQAAKIHEDLMEIPEADTVLAQARELCRSYGMEIYEIDALLKQAALSFKMPEASGLNNYPAEELENLISRVNKSGGRQQLVHSLAFAVEAAGRAEQYDQARQYAAWLLQETEVLSRQYDQEKRLIFFQHSIYDDVKAAINLEIRMGKNDSAFAKLDYVKSRALRRRLNGLPASKLPSAAAAVVYADPQKLRRQLRPEEAIIDYMVTDDSLYAFMLTAADLQIFHSAVSRRELQALVLQYLAELAPADRAGEYTVQEQKKNFVQAIQLSHALYNKLVEPIARPLEKIERLYIVPDEFLHLLPFNTLALQERLEPEFLIERCAIMYLPAASLYGVETSNAGAAQGSPPRLLASVDSSMHGAAKISARLAGLKNTQATVRTQWKSQAEFEAGLAGPYQIYFFYAHAEANWDDPWQSYIQFQLQSPRSANRLTYADVDSLNWRNVALVILAGCETAGKRIYSGAGLSGLQRSFLGAGAGQVLATFWEVDAAQVTTQMANFLEVFSRSGDAVLALQEVQRAAIVSLRKDPYLIHPHPRYWGAYNLTGTRVTAPLSSKYVVDSFK